MPKLHVLVLVFKINILFIRVTFEHRCDKSVNVSTREHRC